MSWVVRGDIAGNLEGWEGCGGGRGRGRLARDEEG